MRTVLGLLDNYSRALVIVLGTLVLSMLGEVGITLLPEGVGESEGELPSRRCESAHAILEARGPVGRHAVRSLRVVRFFSSGDLVRKLHLRVHVQNLKASFLPPEVL